MNILCLYDGSGPKYHRVLLPAYGLQKFDHQVKVVNELKESDLPGIDLILFNRMISGWTVEGITRMKDKYGFKLVCDLDDHWIVGRDHMLHQAYKELNISDVIFNFILEADAVTVTHDRLRDEVEPYNANVHVLPNAIPKVAQFDIQKTDDHLVRLFWAGGITHKKDIELLKRPLQLIKRDKVRLVMAGYVHGQPEWKEMASMFTTNSNYNTTVFESLKVFEYYRAYAHCDISLIPLVDNYFNRHKSNLKILEAANIGAPVIVSRVHPYLDFPEELVNYVDSHNTWFKQINKLVNSEELRYSQGYALQAYCDRHFNFDKISQQRNQLFNDTIKSSEIRKVPAEAGGVAE